MNLQDLQEAYNQVHQLDEAEGSYGQTPKARESYGKLANKRRETPASEYSERGEKTKKVKSAEKHFNRTGNPDAGNRGKKSTKPSFHSGARKGMTQSDRDHARGEAEYGHTGYDPDFDGGPSGPGGKPKGKKAERQKKTGVSAESFNAYEVVLDYLLEEGFASSEESADKIILNMSEAWFGDIMEATRAAKEGMKDEHRVGVAIRADRAKKSLEAKAKRDKEIDKYEKESGRKVDRTKSKEYKSHAEYFGGSRQEKKVKGKKETESETQNRRAGRQVLRVLKHGHTTKEKAESKAREEYDSPRD